MKNIFLLISLIIMSSAFADVWESSNEWSVEYELKYQQWIESNGYNRRIFSNPDSPYYGVPTDCADVAYAARIIFSYENKLPFKIKNPDRKGIFSSFNISNKQNTFDNLKTELERVKAFISKVSVHAGTYSLAKNDTYPVAINDIRPGDLYVTQFNGIKHAYVVVKVYSSGVMDLYYSTLPRVVREIKFHRGVPLFSFSASPWGFRRFKNPDQINLDDDEIEGHSNEQYELLKKFGPDRILDEISNLLRKEDEGVEGKVERLIENLCRSMNDRVDAVNRSLEYVQANGGRCVNMAEYHNYSTPGLDSRISKQITTLKNFWNVLLKKGIPLKISHDIQEALTSLIDPNFENHHVLCPALEKQYDPIDFFFNLEEGIVSAHPNASWEARWGKTINESSKCQNYYQ